MDARVDKISRLHDLVLKNTETYEEATFHNQTLKDWKCSCSIGTQLAYLMGAIAQCGKVDAMAEITSLYYWLKDHPQGQEFMQYIVFPEG